MRYWAEAWQWTNANAKNFAWWKAAPSSAIAVARYLIIGGDVMKDLGLMLPIIIGTFGLCWVGEYAWLILFRAPVALQGKRNAEVQALRLRVSTLERQVDDTRPRLTLIVSPHLGPSLERWIWICNVGQRTAFDARIQSRATDEYRLDFLPIPLVRGDERLDITDKVRVSRKSRGTWYEEARPIIWVGEILTDNGGMFEDVKTEIEISYMDNGVPIASKSEMSAHKDLDGVVVQVTGQQF
jgi:hypothetical protein